MKQMNEMSARALSMEELEQVNGGLGFGLIPDDDHTKENIAQVVYVTAPSVQERSRECKDSRDLSRLQPYTFADFRFLSKCNKKTQNFNHFVIKIPINMDNSKTIITFVPSNNCRTLKIVV